MMSAKLSIYLFLLLAVGLSVLFSPAIGRAQNSSSLCESGFESRWGWKYVWKYKTNYNTGKLDYVYVNDYVYDCFPTGTGDRSATSNGENSANRNSNSGVSSEIRLLDLVGSWEGLFDKIACTLEIEKVEGDKFYGTLKRQSASVAVTGTINSKARSINFSPTKIVTMDNTRDWRLGFNWGDFSNDGKSISGKGYGDLAISEWYFAKKSAISSNNQQRATKVPLSMKDRLPEQLGEFKRVELYEFPSILRRDDSEEKWSAKYQIKKGWEASVEISRYKDSTSASKAKDSNISGLKIPILTNESVTNQVGQVTGELVICKADAGIAFLRHNNYFYLIVAKDKMLLEKILKNLPLD